MDENDFQLIIMRTPCIWVLGRVGVGGIDGVDWVSRRRSIALSRRIRQWPKSVQNLVAIEKVLEGRWLWEVG